MKIKKRLIILALFMAHIVMCQTIKPLSSLDRNNGDYSKDLDGVLLPYVGTWEGTLNNKKYTFVFKIFEQHQIAYSPEYTYYRDKLMGNFKVTDLTTNQVIYDNTATTNYDDFRIYSTIPSIIHGWCFFHFVDTDVNCQNGLKFTLMNVIGQPNQLKYCYFEYDEFWRYWDCTNFPDRMSIPVFLPMNELILTKL